MAALGWLLNLDFAGGAAAVTVVSKRYKLVGADDDRFSLTGTENDRFKIDGAQSDRFTLFGTCKE